MSKDFLCSHPSVFVKTVPGIKHDSNTESSHPGAMVRSRFCCFVWCWHPGYWTSIQWRLDICWITATSQCVDAQQKTDGDTGCWKTKRDDILRLTSWLPSFSTTRVSIVSLPRWHFGVSQLWCLDMNKSGRGVSEASFANDYWLNCLK